MIAPLLLSLADAEKDLCLQILVSHLRGRVEDLGQDGPRIDLQGKLYIGQAEANIGLADPVVGRYDELQCCV
jgi:hypothetical protein